MKNKSKGSEWEKRDYLGGKHVNKVQDQDLYGEMGLIR